MHFYAKLVSGKSILGFGVTQKQITENTWYFDYVNKIVLVGSKSFKM